MMAITTSSSTSVKPVDSLGMRLGLAVSFMMLCVFAYICVYVYFTYALKERREKYE
jgi:hypothetical protein